MLPVQVARQINGANELWLAVALTHVSVQSLAPARLAGLMAALVAQEAVSKPTVMAAYAPSEGVIQAVQALEPERQRLFEQQQAQGVEADLTVDLRLAGVSWPHICGEAICDDFLRLCTVSKAEPGRTEAV